MDSTSDTDLSSGGDGASSMSSVGRAQLLMGSARSKAQVKYLCRYTKLRNVAWGCGAWHDYTTWWHRSPGCTMA